VEVQLLQQLNHKLTSLELTLNHRTRETDNQVNQFSQLKHRLSPTFDLMRWAFNRYYLDSLEKRVKLRRENDEIT
jgi:hypothetical protein